VDVAGAPTLRGHVPTADARKRLAMAALRAVRGHVDVRLEVVAAKPDAPAP
jgi:hypothetical protein